MRERRMGKGASRRARVGRVRRADFSVSCDVRPGGVPVAGGVRVRDRTDRG